MNYDNFLFGNINIVLCTYTLQVIVWQMYIGVLGNTMQHR